MELGFLLLYRKKIGEEESMGEKDVSEKYLLAFDDVFADVYNVLFFAADVVKQENLRRGGSESIYSAGDKARVQQRDVVKEYVKDGCLL